MLTDEELDAIEARQPRSVLIQPRSSSADVTTLVAEVRSLRTALGDVKARLADWTLSSEYSDIALAVERVDAALNPSSGEVMPRGDA